MSKYGPWIGGALGWAMGGPIGGILGYSLGKMFSGNSLSAEGARTHSSRGSRRTRHTQPGDFAASLLVLSAAVMKADDKVMKSELHFVQSFLRNNFGATEADQLTVMLRDILDQPLNVRQIAEQVRFNMEHSKRLLLLQYLYGIARADGQVHTAEIDMIRRISNWLGISEKDRLSIEEVFYKIQSNPYAVLEITAEFSDAQVKKAYRRLAIKCHPDKVLDLGQSHRAQAKERFIAIQEAYEQIKNERGMK